MNKSNYMRYLVNNPLRELGANRDNPTKGRQVPAMTYLNNTLVPGCNVYLECGWIYKMPDPNPHIFEHAHEYDEVVLHIGSDPNNPEDLGAELVFEMDGEKLVVDKTSAIFVPKGVNHGPLTWNKVYKPHLEMTIMLGAGSLEEAKTAGFHR